MKAVLDLTRRKELGLDTYDEVWQGVYRVVSGPSPGHGTMVLEVGALVLEVGAFLRSLAGPAGLRVAAPANIGRDGGDFRVPDIVVYKPDTPAPRPLSWPRPNW